MNLSNLNDKDQIVANMQVVHNILNGGTEVKTGMGGTIEGKSNDITEFKTEMLIAA